MHARKRPPRKTPIWMPSSWVSFGSASVHAMTPTAAATIARIGSRLYQPVLSKHRMNVSRYSASGATHSSGTAATFCVMWLDTASSRIEPVAASVHQRSWRDTVGGASSWSSPGPGVDPAAAPAARIRGARAWRRLAQPAAAQSTTNSA